MAVRKGVVGAITGAVAVALIAGVSLVWPGLDAQQAPPVNSTVWVLQTGEGNRYARVNTAVAELDTVRAVSNPSSIVQNGVGAYLFSDTSSRITTINDASPLDLNEDELRASPATPSGTRDVSSAGDYVVYRTDGGEVYWGTLSEADAHQINPYEQDAEPTATASEGEDSETADEELPEYKAQAAVVTEKGTLIAYSAVDGAVLRYSIPEARVLGTDAVADVGEAIQLTAVGETWVLFDETNQRVTVQGADAAQKVETGGTPLLNRVIATGAHAYLADESGLIAIPTDGTAPSRTLGEADTTLGTPTRPAPYQGDVYGAWLDSERGVLWRSGNDPIELRYEGNTLDDTRVPRLTGSDAGMVLNEVRSGWVWTIPDGKLLASSQDWLLDTPTEQDAEVSDVEAEVVLQPKPPIAVADQFGVRAGGITSLPVLLNDHDPNEDVLTIDAASVTGLDANFGTVALTDGGGRLTVVVKAGATGSATFTYRVTDGTSKDGLYSEPTSVTLTVTDAKSNAAPKWCGTKECLATWPVPEVKPGGTVTVPVLNGWVDPDGDPMLVSGVTVPSGIGAAAVTPNGEVVYQHTNPSATDVSVVALDVEISDTFGAAVTKTLKVRVTPTPKLTVQSFSLTDIVGVDLSIDVAQHVLGTSGDLRLDSVQVLDEESATATLPGAGTSFDFAAKQPGTYRVQFTVSDGVSTATGTSRITLLAADASAQLATAPVVAFVRPQEDATIDVFAAVSNPTRRVLLLSDIEVIPDVGASMQVDGVAQQYLRIAGMTLTGEPGRLGVVNYRVGDGSKSADANVSGQATIYLLPPATDLAPIAVDDAIVARAGAQIDIPALENDVAPSGAALILDPSSVTSSTKDALAFGAGSEVRYLAPSKPGDYTITYSVYAAGSPSKQDQATIKVTVIGNEDNRDPRPKMLEGRVLAGQATTIPFTSFGLDPDGDDVTLTRILTQPAKGSAAITPDGTGITYTSVPGTRGQYSFTYRVTDSHGSSKTGTVRVGVLDQQSNPSPVTFTDYVQVQVGAGNRVNISPVLNDIDPTGGELELTSVEPNLTEKLDDQSTNPEYTRWKSLLVSVDETTAVVEAGDTPGTMSFLYNVKSESGNTARGLIVVKVVREAVPDYPIVADTSLTVETREQFEKGVDVLTGKVTWGGGDVGGLKLSLWRSADNVKVSGSSISGSLPEKARIIPFAVAGTASDGTDVTTYAFLRIPGDDDKSISLRSNLSPVDVIEKESKTFDVVPMIAVPKDADLEIDGSVATSGVRANATCVIAGTQVTYSAGEGAPWSDACVISARVKGQDEWTVLSIPVRVTPLEPMPKLAPASITVNPGASETFDLKSMTSWDGRTDWDKIVYAVSASASADFTVVQSGATVTVTAADTALPGRESSVSVNVSSHPGVQAAPLNLRVGAAPTLLPKAGATTKQCSTASASSCSITVTGAPGEVNPLPKTPLVLTSVAATASCEGVTFSVTDANTVTATWEGDTPGSTCTVPFTLQDAQGRQTSADRQGSIFFDLQGLPRAPAAITQVRFADGTLGLAVDPGASASSYPAISGFTVTDGSSTFTCSTTGACADLNSANGVKRTFTATAVNSVGSSKSSVQTTAWAYDPPTAPTSVTWKPVPNGNDGKRISVTLQGVDGQDASSLTVAAPTASNKVVSVGAGDTTASFNFDIGSNTPVEVTVTPVARFEVPSGTGPTSLKGSFPFVANGIGAPLDVTLALSYEPTSTTQATVSASASASSGGTGSTIEFRIVKAGQNCNAGSVSDTRVDTGQTRNRKYTFDVCATSKYDGESFGTTVATGFEIAVPADDSPPTGYTFRVSKTPTYYGDSASYFLDYPISGNAPSGFTAEFQGYNETVFGVDPGIQVAWRSNDLGTLTQWGSVVPHSGSAPYQVRVSWEISGCQAGTPIGVAISAEAGGTTPTVTLNTSSVVYLDENGAVIPDNDADPLTPPPHTGPFTVSGLSATISWPSWGLQTISTNQLSKTCSS